MTGEPDGKRGLVLVTGAAGGIGRATGFASSAWIQLNPDLEQLENAVLEINETEYNRVLYVFCVFSTGLLCWDSAFINLTVNPVHGSR